jgi:hypothetical protein
LPIATDQPLSVKMAGDAVKLCMTQLAKLVFQSTDIPATKCQKSKEAQLARYKVGLLAATSGARHPGVPVSCPSRQPLPGEQVGGGMPLPLAAGQTRKILTL